MSRHWLGILALGAAAALPAACNQQPKDQPPPAANEAAAAESPAAPPAPAAPSAPLTDTDAERTLKVGEEVEVQLPESAGTGYAWELSAPPPAGVVLVDKRVDVPARPAGSAPVAGGGQTVVFRLRATAPGRADLVFVHRQPWREPQPDDQIVTHKLNVEP
jgi:predicted secreted protein